MVYTIKLQKYEDLKIELVAKTQFHSRIQNQLKFSKKILQINFSVLVLYCRIQINFSVLVMYSRIQINFSYLGSTL